MDDVTSVKRVKDLSVRRWKALIQCEGKNKTGKKVDVLNHTRIPGYIPIILKRSSLVAVQVVIMFTLPGMTRGSLERHRSARHQRTVVLPPIGHSPRYSGNLYSHFTPDWNHKSKSKLKQNT